MPRNMKKVLKLSNLSGCTVMTIGYVDAKISQPIFTILNMMCAKSNFTMIENKGNFKEHFLLPINNYYKEN